MKYLCKLFTPEFRIKLDQAISEETDRKLKGRNIASDRASFAKEFEMIRIRDSYNTLYNKPEIFKDNPEVIEYYTSVGLYPAEFTEIVLESKEYGLQSRARVEWNGKIEKIDEIDEIFSYKTIN